MTLPAGKYLFRNPDTPGGRRVVQVLSADGMQAYGQAVCRARTVGQVRTREGYR